MVGHRFIPLSKNSEQEDIEYLKGLIRPRAFGLYRYVDKSEVSGLGFVATGVEFTDGFVIMRWRSDMPSLGLYTDIKHVEEIHGHKGDTEIMWLDE